MNAFVTVKTHGGGQSAGWFSFEYNKYTKKLYPNLSFYQADAFDADEAELEKAIHEAFPISAVPQSNHAVKDIDIHYHSVVEGLFKPTCKKDVLNYLKKFFNEKFTSEKVNVNREIKGMLNHAFIDLDGDEHRSEEFMAGELSYNSFRIWDSVGNTDWETRFVDNFEKDKKDIEAKALNMFDEWCQENGLELPFKKATASLEETYPYCLELFITFSK